jgi:hypothetical protein
MEAISVAIGDVEYELSRCDGDFEQKDREFCSEAPSLSRMVICDLQQKVFFLRSFENWHNPGEGFEWIPGNVPGANQSPHRNAIVQPIRTYGHRRGVEVLDISWQTLYQPFNMKVLSLLHLLKPSSSSRGPQGKFIASACLDSLKSYRPNLNRQPSCG